MLYLRVFAILLTTIGTIVLWHEYGIVLELPIDVIIGGDILIPHKCSLQYTSNQQKKIKLNNRDCSICAINLADNESGTKAQLMFAESTVIRKRNRLNLNPIFMAVLPTLPQMGTVGGTLSENPES